jgi:hypothetical protein
VKINVYSFQEHTNMRMLYGHAHGNTKEVMEDILRTCYELPFQAHREINKSRCYIANIGMVKAAVIQKTFPNP